MKQLRRFITLVFCLMVAVSPMVLAESLGAEIDGCTLNVNWSVECGGTAVLTVYQNNWPISIFYVNCADSGVSVNIGKPAGKYSVRLRTDLGCLTASAAAPEATAAPTAIPTPEATAVPTAIPTAIPTPEATTVPTAIPTAIPTPEVTATYTAEPTQEPTLVPTAIPTPKATAAPTPVITPSPRPTATPSPTTNGGSGQSDLASQVVALVNAERANAGLSQLRVDSELTRAACVRAQEIVQLFSHTRPDGRSWSTVSPSAHGENIAMGYRSASAVMVGWMNSQGHRENILRSSFGSIGVCAYTYGGTTYWVQLFGY